MLTRVLIKTPHQSSTPTISVLLISPIKALKLIFRISKSFD